MDLKAKLQEAKALISDVNRWTQGQNAANEAGYGVLATDETACRWCARGALLKVFGIEELISEVPLEERTAYYAVRDTLDQCASIKHPEKSMLGVNDEIGHAAVMEMFDCAISKYSL